MGTVRFTTRDAELLYSFPRPATELATVVRHFTFINRTAPPTYDELAGCLTRAMRAGIVREEGGRYVVGENWYARIHGADATSENEIESLLEFQGAFVGVDFDETAAAASVPTEDEYRSILARLPILR